MVLNKKNAVKELEVLYRNYRGKQPDRSEEILLSVSNRRYFRLSSGEETCIGTYSPDVRETRAFISFTAHFRKLGLNVPEILAVSDDERFYLQSDLGNMRLHEMVTGRAGASLDKKLLTLYKSLLNQLVKLQIEGDRRVDYSVCVPRPAFDRQSILWDLNHFKYYFLKPSGLPFDEQLLEEAFRACADRVSGIHPQGFMFRDFQSRNVMVCNGKPFMIDYQGGRRGPVHYDLASLLFEAKVALTEADRLVLLNHYLEQLEVHGAVDRDLFLADFYVVSLVRLLQALGAYGLRGNVEKRAVFLQSIPNALRFMEQVLSRIDDAGVTAYFRELLTTLAGTAGQYRELPEPFGGLTITICSFSYRKQLPDDITGNGGGFVYDCRLLTNPGKCEELSQLNGFDVEVVRFLESDPEVGRFLEITRRQLEMAIQKYQEIGNGNLMVAFGCTGGRHRSVYCAHAIAAWCRTLPGVRVLEIHREMGLEY